jgi:hypothetical protein
MILCVGLLAESSSSASGWLARHWRSSLIASLLLLGALPVWRQSLPDCSLCCAVLNSLQVGQLTLCARRRCCLVGVAERNEFKRVECEFNRRRRRRSLTKVFGPFIPTHAKSRRALQFCRGRERARARASTSTIHTLKMHTRTILHGQTINDFAGRLNVWRMRPDPARSIPPTWCPFMLLASARLRSSR